jgi:hypothetical protein
LSRLAPPLRFAFWLFCGMTCFYLLGLGGHIHTPDGVLMSRLSGSIAAGDGLAVEPLERWKDFGGQPAGDGAESDRIHLWFGPGLSFAAIPTQVVASAVDGLASDAERDLFDQGLNVVAAPDGSGRKLTLRSAFYDTGPQNFDEAFAHFAASWTNGFVAGACLAVLFLLCLELGYRRRSALGVAVVAGLATPLWAYAREFFSEPLGGLTLMLSLLFLVRGTRVEDRRRAWFLAGLCLGLSVLTRVAHGMFVLPVAVFLLADLLPLARGEDAQRRRRWFHGVLGFAVGLALCLAVLAVYNYTRFGSPLETGYGGVLDRWTTPFLEGFGGLLISPGRGLFVYCPILLASLAALPSFTRRHGPVAAFMLLALLELLLFYATWYRWEGGWCWAPRFLIPVVPLLVLPLAEFLENPPRARSSRYGLVVLTLASGLVAWSGTRVSYNDFTNWVRYEHVLNQAEYARLGIENYYDLLLWDWSMAPVVKYWGFPSENYFLLEHALRSPGIALAFFGLAAVGLVLSILMGRRAWRALPQDPQVGPA